MTEAPHPYTEVLRRNEGNSQRIAEAFNYYGRFPLMADVRNALEVRRTKPTTMVAAADTQYSNVHATWDGYLSNPRRPENRHLLVTEGIIAPEIHVGMNGSNINEILFSWTASHAVPAEDGSKSRILQHKTTAALFGFDDNREILDEYYMNNTLWREGVPLPPLGLYVDYSCSEDNELLVWTYGYPLQNGKNKNWWMVGYSLDNSVLPLPEHLYPGERFKFSASNAFLPPVEETLKPDFFKKTLLNKNL